MDPGWTDESSCNIRVRSTDSIQQEVRAMWWILRQKTDSIFTVQKTGWIAFLPFKSGMLELQSASWTTKQL